MNIKDIIRMVLGTDMRLTSDEWLLVNQAIESEREACAKVCDGLAAQDKLSNYYAVAANAIRARSETHDGH